MHTITFTFILSSIPFGYSKLRFVLEEEIEKCSDEPWRADFSNFKLVMIDDVTTVANGTTVLLEELKSPWKMNFYGEMYDRGQWNKKFERKFDDFCKYNLRFGEM